MHSGIFKIVLYSITKMKEIDNCIKHYIFYWLEILMLFKINFGECIMAICILKELKTEKIIYKRYTGKR